MRKHLIWLAALMTIVPVAALVAASPETDEALAELRKAERRSEAVNMAMHTAADVALQMGWEEVAQLVRPGAR